MDIIATLAMRAVLTSCGGFSMFSMNLTSHRELYIYYYSLLLCPITRSNLIRAYWPTLCHLAQGKVQIAVYSLGLF